MSEVTTRDSDVPPSPEAAETAEIQPALELDCRGMNCPLPILKTKKAIDTIDSGQVLRMTAADPGSIDHCVVAHLSAEAGHKRLLDRIGRSALVDLGMRLGEASGATLVLLPRFDAVFHPNGALWAALQHGSDIELAVAGSGDVWQREYFGPMDTTDIGVAIRQDGRPTACFFRSGNLMVY